MPSKFPWIIVIILLLYIYYTNSKIKSNVEPLVITRDSIIRDSIYIVNDSIITKIKYIYKEYDKEVVDIISSNDSTNLVLFSRYIENYQRTIKNN